MNDRNAPAAMENGPGSGALACKTGPTWPNTIDAPSDARVICTPVTWAVPEFVMSPVTVTVVPATEAMRFVIGSAPPKSVLTVSVSLDALGRK